MNIYKISDKIIELKLELMGWKGLEKELGGSLYTQQRVKHFLGVSELLTEALENGFEYTNDTYDAFWGKASQEDIAEKVEINVLEQQKNDITSQ
jgi:hypothetical protein